MRRLLLFSVLFGFALSIAAQKAQRELVLVDAKGNVVPDGAVLSFSKMEDSEYDDYKQISSGLKLRNISRNPLNVMATVEIVDISAGTASFQLCFPTECYGWEEKGLRSTAAGVVAPFAEQVGSKANNDRELHTDLIVDKASYATVILRFYTTSSPETDEEATPGQLLTTVTLKFKADATGIESLKHAAQNAGNEVWNLQGTLVGRNISNLNSLPKGLYLVRQNGKTTKVAVGK